MILSSDFTWLSPVWRRASTGAERAWFVTPEGEVIPGQGDHATFVRGHQDFFAEKGVSGISHEELVGHGWAIAGIANGVAYINCQKLTQKLFDVLQDIVLNGRVHYVQIVDRSVWTSDGIVELSRKDFLELNGPNDVRRIQRARFPQTNRKKSSLPDSRDFLKGIPLEKIPKPLQDAFDLLGLTAKLEHITAPQVASAFNANNELLLKKVHWTATDLLRELNKFVQYDAPPKKQLVV